LGTGIKDIKKTMNNLSDNGLEKIVELGSLSFFNSDPYFNFVYKKSERLCMAIYLITDFFPSEDSIKDNMRKAGAELLKVSLSLINASSPLRRNILNDISRLCLEVTSLSKIASNLGMTSGPNHNVLENEIMNFISVIETRERPNTTGQGFVLNEELLGGKDDDSSKQFNKSFYHVDEKSGVSTNSSTSDHSTQNMETNEDEEKSSSFVSKTEILVSHVKSEKKEILNNNTEVNNTDVLNHSVESLNINSISPANINSIGPAPVKSVMQKNERQQIILGIIKEIGESSIKDISDNIRDCSEKTIQRELNTLIYDGVLKKIGERRWSKYILA